MAEPANRQTNPAGGKYYVHPVTGERFDSVTTILDLVDKAALKIWSGMVAADFAFDHLPQLLHSMLVQECGNTNNRCYLKHGPRVKCERCPCGDCEKCWWRRVAWRHAEESNRRAQEGTEVHEAINAWVLQGGATISLRKAVQPYFDSFQQWVTDYGLHPNNTGLGSGSWEQTEVTLLNREYGYAGTSDGAVWLRRSATRLADEMLDRLGLDQALIRVDYKTREKPDEKLYYDMPLQGVAYERCSKAMLPNGEEFEAPKTDARAILQLRPADYTFTLMLSDDEVFDAFVGVLTAYRWINGPGKKPFDMDVHFPLVTVERAVETIQTVLDADVIEDPAGVDYAAVQEAAYSDPWAQHEQPEREPTPAEVVEVFYDEMTVGEAEDAMLEPVSLKPEVLDELPPIPPPPPPKKTTDRDPWAAHHPNQVWADANRGKITHASMSSQFNPGQPQLDLLEEPIPF